MRRPQGDGYNSSPYTQRAEIPLGAGLNPIANRRSGLRLLFFALLALGFELRVLLRRQDPFGCFHVFGLTGLVAARLVMLFNGSFHLCLLIGCQIETRQ